jgi:membrane-associated PAP2 superfamily phosphatase
MKMIVKMNGQYFFDTEERSDFDEVVVVKKSNKLKKFALTLWTTSGLMFAKTTQAETFYENMQPLTYTFQDIALGLGILSALAGFILLGVKKRWGAATLKTTALVVGGVFLVPSLLMLVAIVGTMLNEAFVEAFQDVRGSGEVKDVMGK